MKYEKTAKRMREALERAEISAKDLSIKSEVPEASISQYVNGHHKPSNISAGRMAEYLNVNPLWLMGFDVPMEAEPEKKYEYYLNEETKELVDFLHSHPEYKVLFDASRKVKLEDIDFVKRMIDKFGGE